MQTIWTWHRRLAGDGMWDRGLERLLTVADEVGAIDWAVWVDSTIVRAINTLRTLPATQGA